MSDSQPEERFITLRQVQELMGWSWMWTHTQQRRLFPPPHHIGGYGNRTYFWRESDLEPILDGLVMRRRGRRLAMRYQGTRRKWMADRYISASELARQAGLSRQRISKIVAEWPPERARREGRQVLIPRSVAAEWLGEREAAAR